MLEQRFNIGCDYPDCGSKLYCLPEDEVVMIDSQGWATIGDRHYCLLHAKEMQQKQQASRKPEPVEVLED